MITTFFLYVIYLFVYAVTSPFRIFSDVSIDSNIVQAFTTGGEYVNALSIFLPVATLLTVLGIVMTIEGGIFSYKGAMWLLKRIPTQS